MVVRASSDIDGSLGAAGSVRKIGYVGEKSGTGGIGDKINIDRDSGIVGEFDRRPKAIDNGLWRGYEAGVDGNGLNCFSHREYACCGHGWPPFLN
jgi:hypothetical protein